MDKPEATSRTASPGFSVLGIPGVPMVSPGDDLTAIIVDALRDARITLEDGDIVCVAQKIVSKAEGRQIPLASVTPSEEAQTLAEETDKDPRLVELILRESSEVMRKKEGVLIVRHRLGLVGANAGIDQSNISHEDGEQALLLPEDPDRSAAELKSALDEASGARVGVIITDSANRPWRLGTVGIAIGCAGISVLDDHRGGVDLFDRELKVTLISRADGIAGAATLVMGETTERIPVALVRGFPAEQSTDDARMVCRPLHEDLFR
ncbi:MAG TPA: coenzyme F420-0:L-glutamate ligase [Pseudomonadales bacterium]|jgi:coenzyme F420-0:L-glutamate ligase/coenzyme F420-1:gamma-L-glutamate ligase